jgi:glyoxylase-like metal-dependent hydrolase (beta-lactamase superfamily II)
VSGDGERLVVRQLLSGRDFALGDPFAAAMVNYAYLVGDRATRAAVLVDPAYDPVGLLELADTDGYSVSGVVLTHFHPDHAGGDLGGEEIAGVAALREVADIPLHA